MTEDDFVGLLALEGRSGIAAFHEFRMARSDRGGQVHVFFEGDEDALFYLPAIRGRAGTRDIRIYYCGGKWGVIGVRDAIEGETGLLTDCLFFIDRDYDDYLDSQPPVDANTYITDGYSVENDVVSTYALDILLVEFGKVSKVDPQYAVAHQDWVLAHRQFVRAIRPIVAWCLAMREVKHRPNLNNVDLRRVIRCWRGRYCRAAGGALTFAKMAARREETVAIGDIRRWLRRLKLDEYKKWVRGKYELWHFRHFVLSFLSRRRDLNRNWVIPTAVREGRLFEILGGRIGVRPSLSEFLERQLP
jgi:hypothetical protein